MAHCAVIFAIAQLSCTSKGFEGKGMEGKRREGGEKEEGGKGRRKGGEKVASWLWGDERPWIAFRLYNCHQNTSVIR